MFVAPSFPARPDPLSTGAQEPDVDDLLLQVRHLRFILDHVPNRIWLKDCDNRILSLNQAAAESMGTTVAAATGANTYDLFGQMAAPYHRDDIEVMESGVPRLGIEERYTPVGGAPGYCRTDKLPLKDSRSGEDRILVVSSDVTELTEQRAKLESINKNLEDFASLASHDLQTPLRHIALFCEMLTAHLDGKVDAEATEFLNGINQGVGEMRALVQSFLRFVRDAPNEFDMETVDLATIIEGAQARQSLLLSEAGATFDLPDFTPAIVGDAQLLTQVFSNLFENAVKYRHHDRAPHISITSKDDDGRVRIELRDNGIGIEKGHEEDIFSLFARSRSPEGVNGSGIGLALCRRIIVHHGGTISCEQPVGVGSHLIINLKGAAL